MSEADATTFNDLIKQAYRANPELFAKLMTTMDLGKSSRLRIYVELMSVPSGLSASDLIKRGFPESTVYRVLKTLMRAGLVTRKKIETPRGIIQPIDSTKFFLRDKRYRPRIIRRRGGPRISIWTI